MAVINDLINKIQDPDLKNRIQEEVNKLSKQKKFGLVFEEHIPECTPLFDVPIHVGSKVSIKDKKVSTIYIVKKLIENTATCLNRTTQELIDLPLNELVTIAEFGEPIYPYLKPIDSICNATDSNLWHTLIEADNYHALQLLEYLYAGKVDCIYIDPPYNSGARDWKYNNDYVDSSDSYRHSKWLSMMDKRLKLAKKLLNPSDSVLIVTIDEKEYLHLGCLLEELFPDARIQMVSSVINPAGSSRQNEFSRTDEFIFFVKFGSSSPSKLPLGPSWEGNVTKTGNKKKLGWNSLLRSGTSIYRTDRPNMFYPIYLNNEATKIIDIGEPIPRDMEINEIPPVKNSITIWPILSDGQEGRWRVGYEKLKELVDNHYVRIGIPRGEKTSLSYVPEGARKKIENGEYEVLGYRLDGSIITDDENHIAKFLPGTQWWINSHNATQFGTKLINQIVGKSKFDFPKSLYAVHDAIQFFVKEKKNALILDFFAGSGTTLHAINLLNAEDEGKRRCIMVTNNEVSDEKSKKLRKDGYKPGDPEWEKLGIAHYVTWPRTVCSIKGIDINEKPLNGTYLDTTLDMSDGFKSNAAFFKLGFLDKNDVALGRQFKELLPVLWMKTGCIGKCPELSTKNLPSMLILPKNDFAVLIDEHEFSEFKEKINTESSINNVFIVTDSIGGYREMISHLNIEKSYQLYRDYLDNFRINTGR